jgi:hypothetical protein
LISKSISLNFPPGFGHVTHGAELYSKQEERFEKLGPQRKEKYMKSTTAIRLMQESLDSMQRSGVLDGVVVVNSDTVILGTGSFLNSLGFVTFISDMEERMSAETGQEHYLVLTEIHEFNADQAFLSAGKLAQYIEKITE